MHFDLELALIVFLSVSTTLLFLFVVLFYVEWRLIKKPVMKALAKLLTDAEEEEVQDRQQRCKLNRDLEELVQKWILATKLIKLCQKYKFPDQPPSSWEFYRKSLYCEFCVLAKRGVSKHVCPKELFRKMVKRGS